jgi:hypothetical protein
MNLSPVAIERNCDGHSANLSNFQKAKSTCDSNIPKCHRCLTNELECDYNDPFTNRILRRGQLEETEEELRRTQQLLAATQQRLSEIETALGGISQERDFLRQDNYLLQASHSTVTRYGSRPPILPHQQAYPQAAYPQSLRPLLPPLDFSSQDYQQRRSLLPEAQATATTPHGARRRGEFDPSSLINVGVVVNYVIIARPSSASRKSRSPKRRRVSQHIQTPTVPSDPSPPVTQPQRPTLPEPQISRPRGSQSRHLESEESEQIQREAYEQQEQLQHAQLQTEQWRQVHMQQLPLQYLSPYSQYPYMQPQQMPLQPPQGLPMGPPANPLEAGFGYTPSWAPSPFAIHGQAYLSQPQQAVPQQVTPQQVISQQSVHPPQQIVWYDGEDDNEQQYQLYESQ